MLNYIEKSCYCNQKAKQTKNTDYAYRWAHLALLYQMRAMEGVFERVKP